MTDLFDRVRAYRDQDVDGADRDALTELLTAAESGDTAAQADLEDRFQGPLVFGTAGLRGLVGAGLHRMNRSVVIRATYGLVTHLLEAVPDAAKRGVVIGRDGRRGSDVFQKDAAAVMAARGVKVHFLTGTTPTPLTAFSVRHLNAAAGIVITASHNPPEYNGYKVYWDNGAQIASPIDRGIADAIERAPSAQEIALEPVPEPEGLVETLEAAYLEGLERLAFVTSAPMDKLRVAYSAMLGVGAHLFQRAASARGLTQVFSVPEQNEPDPAFPTVRFPNPEEPGAMDLVLALAKKETCDIVLVNDPDADRLAVAVRNAAGDYTVLSGNEVGVLLADHVLRRTEGADRLVVTTLVSSRLLEKIAVEQGVRYAETLTGFKWIINEALQLEQKEGLRCMLGYEEALGYAVGSLVRDKDGIGAAMVMAELAAELKAEGRTLLDARADLWRRHGVFVGRQKSVVLTGQAGAAQIRAAMATLREQGLDAVPQAEALWDLDRQIRQTIDGQTESAPRWSSNVLVYTLTDGGRVAVRPSGTEPKLKLYMEVIESIIEGEAHDAAIARGQHRLDALGVQLLERAGLSNDD